MLIHYFDVIFQALPKRLEKVIVIFTDNTMYLYTDFFKGDCNIRLFNTLNVVF